MSHEEPPNGTPTDLDLDKALHVSEEHTQFHEARADAAEAALAKVETFGGREVPPNVSSEEYVTLPKVLLQSIFDLAVNSMDFGSGFWDTEDTDTARAVAEIIGVDPIDATPRSHLRNYPHPFRPRGEDSPSPWGGEKGTCRICDRIHLQ